MYSGWSLMLINISSVQFRSEPVNTLKKALNNLLHKSLCFINCTYSDRNYLVNEQSRHACQENRRWSHTNIRTLSRLFQEPNLHNLTISQSYRPVHPERLKQESSQQFMWTTGKIHHNIFHALNYVQLESATPPAVTIVSVTENARHKITALTHAIQH